MTSYSGSVAYLKYVALTNKNGVSVGDTFNGVFGLGAMTDGRANYTSQVIIEKGKTPSLTPIACGRFDGDNARDAKLIKAADGSVVFGSVSSGAIVWDGSYVATDDDKIAYVSQEFQMEKVPAEKIPSIGPKMERIALVAEPRRIAVKYDQITAFEA